MVFPRQPLAFRRWTCRGMVEAASSPLAFCFPNTQVRVRTVRLHHLHHGLAGYPTTWRGEAQIGAEKLPLVARITRRLDSENFPAMEIGSALRPRKVYRALVRGCHNRKLGGLAYSEELLGAAVGARRKDLNLGYPLPGAAS